MASAGKIGADLHMYRRCCRRRRCLLPDHSPARASCSCPWGRLGDACEIDFLAPCRQSPSSPGAAVGWTVHFGGGRELQHASVAVAAPAVAQFLAKLSPPLLRL